MSNRSIDYEVVIIGGGFSGLSVAIKLLEEKNTSFLIYEKADDVGGTWRDNVYPGCGCDVPSHVYSYSFELNPNWSRAFSKQPEILDYIHHCVHKYGLSPFIRYNTKVRKLVFNAAKGYWEVTTNNGDTVTARVVISATGPLSIPNYPNIKGLDTFRGELFHSAHWNHDYDLRDKNVAVIGTGASAIQFIPEIAPMVDNLNIYQRTAPWIMPKLDRTYSKFERQLYRFFPFLQKAIRTLIYWLRELAVFAFLGNKTMIAIAEKRAKKHLYDSVKDEQLRKALTPNYSFGCKRVLPSNNYYPTLERPNVELITTGIRAITTDSIITQDGEHQLVDAIILGTGFKAAELTVEMEIVGLNGKKLADEWQKEGPYAYKGTTLKGFPNLLFFTGPNTGTGHNSIIHIIESQLNYVMSYIKYLERLKGDCYLDVKAHSLKKYNQQIQEELKETVWQTGGCKSWYQTAHGKNTTLFPGSTARFRRALKRINVEDYEVIRV